MMITGDTYREVSQKKKNNTMNSYLTGLTVVAEPEIRYEADLGPMWCDLIRNHQIWFVTKSDLNHFHGKVAQNQCFSECLGVSDLLDIY